MPYQVPGINISEASKSDVSSLSTIVARSFHPVNTYIKRCFPDTPLMQRWWIAGFNNEIKDPNCHLLTALDLSVADQSKRAVGVLCLRRLEPDDKGAGIWTDVNNPFPTDGDQEARKPMIQTMVDHRERLMLGRSHLLLELFGVDHSYKGRGIGLALLQNACEMADKLNHDIFVQANASTRDLYCRNGFQVEAESTMPGDMKYTEYLMIRPCKH